MFNPVIIASEQDIDKETGKHKLEISVGFENYHMSRAQIHENNGATKLMFPQEARLRNFTYVSGDCGYSYKAYSETRCQFGKCHTYHKIIRFILGSSLLC